MTRPGQGGIGPQFKYTPDDRTNGLRQELGAARQLASDPRIEPQNKIGLLNQVERLSREVERREGRR